jgi:perosamine synthetase
MIPYFRLYKSPEELNAVKRISENGTWANGSDIEMANKTISTLLNKEYVVLTSNGYSALFIAIKSLGIVKKKIILPAIGTCFAISNAIIATGNIPVFCDVNLEDGNCSEESVKHLVETEMIQYIISPNYAGNLSSIAYFKDTLKMTVIEDACQSFFSSMLTPNSIADIQVFSFYPTKGINGIDGGAVVTNNSDVYNAAKALVYYDAQEQYETKEHYNFRFLNMNAAVLNSNLDRVHQISNRLNYIEDSYQSALGDTKGISYLKNIHSNCNHRFVLRIGAKEVLNFAKANFEKQSIAFTPFFNWSCDSSAFIKFLNAQILLESCYCIPFFEDLTEIEMESITKTLSHVVAES